MSKATPQEAMSIVYRSYVEHVRDMLCKGFSLSRIDGAGYPRWLAGMRRNSCEMEDITQEVFARAFGRREFLALSEPKRIRAYLYVTTRNLYIDHLRLRSRQRIAPDDELQNLECAQQSSGEPATGSHSAGETERSDSHLIGYRRALDAYLTELPHYLRSIYQARFVHGLSQRQAAEALRLTRQKIRTLEARLVSDAARLLGAESNGRRPASRR